MTDEVERRVFDVRSGGRRLAAMWLQPTAAVAGRAPLVFLHEGLGSMAQWTARGIDAPAELARVTGRPSLLYDRLGFGRSDPLPGPRRPDYLGDEAWTALPGVLDAAGIDRAVLIGHSDGGTIALMFAARHADRTAAIVAEAAHVMVETATLDGIRAARAAFDQPGSRLRAALARHHGDKTEAMFRGWADTWLAPGFDGGEIRALLPAVTAPVLAIQGDADEYGTPAQLEAIAAGIAGPVETWLVPACRHVPHAEAADRVLPRIAAFVADRG